VVIGASMAGLLAARVLANHFEQVTVLERDALESGPEVRKGVPQGRMLHVLLPRGREIVERYFPGYDRELLAAGAVSLRLPADALILTSAGWLDRRGPGLRLLSASRPLFEWTVRRRLQQLPGVTLLGRHDAASLLTSHDGRQVTGVMLRALDGETGRERRLAADLVVDAGGRASRAPAWLAERGYPAPAQTHVDPDVGYASRIYRIPDGFRADWQLVMISAQAPSMPRMGLLLPIEHDRWMLGLMGAAGQHPPTDEDGFAAYLRSLRHPIIADTVEKAEPLTPIRAYRGTVNRLLHYERMPSWPERFLVLGDAVCAFNPVYGQGMSTAAIAAETLDDCLCRQRRARSANHFGGLARRFQRQLARRNTDPWLLSTGEDLRFPTTTGMRVSHLMRVQHRYLDRVLAASSHDQAVAEAFVRVMGMVDRPVSLFAPRLLAAAARAQHPGDDTGLAPPPGLLPASTTGRV
jgi:flavin-dependent dehydrogenase